MARGLPDYVSESSIKERPTTEVESAVYVSIPNNVETSVVKVTDKGKILRIAIWAAHDDIEFRFYVDGTSIKSWALIPDTAFDAAHLSAAGFTDSTPQVQLLKFTDGGTCIIGVTIPFEFNTSFEIKAFQLTGAAKNVIGAIYYAPSL